MHAAACRSNYFTLGKWPLLVEEARANGHGKEKEVYRRGGAGGASVYISSRRGLQAPAPSELDVYARAATLWVYKYTLTDARGKLALVEQEIVL